MDEGFHDAVIKVFVEFYDRGLIFRGKRLVNWDPHFETAISDLEVEQVEAKGHLWRCATSSRTATGDYLVVATTRPETMLGDTGVAVHPDDQRYRDLVGKTVRLPLVGRSIPIVADAYADPTKGTGAVKITPAHDFNDWEVGRRAGLPAINVMDTRARIALKDNAAFWDGAARRRARRHRRPRPLRRPRLVLTSPRSRAGSTASTRRPTSSRTATAPRSRSSRS